MERIYAARTYGIAATALLFPTVMTASVVFFFALRLVRRHKNSMRWWTTLYVVGFGLYVIGLWLDFFASLLTIFRLYNVGEISDDFAMYRASLHLSFISAPLRTWASLLVLLALLELASSITLIHAGEVLAASKGLRLGSLVYAAVLGILALVDFGLMEWLSGMSALEAEVRISSLVSPMRRDLLGFIESILHLVFAVFVLVRSIRATVRTRSAPLVKKATMYLLVCCALMLLRELYNACISAIVLAGLFFGFYISVLFVVFTTWPMVVLLILMFRLGCEKEHRLWETIQPIVDHASEQEMVHSIIPTIPNGRSGYLTGAG